MADAVKANGEAGEGVMAAAGAITNPQYLDNLNT